MPAARRLAAALVAGVLLACTPAYSDPEGYQLPLFGDRVCSDPVFGQTAGQCCAEHDNCYAFGARWTPDGRKLTDEASFALCNAEFEVCMLAWGVPPGVADARRDAVDQLGWRSFNKRENR